MSDVEKILEASNGGLAFFEQICGREFSLTKHFKSPLYQDNNASAKVKQFGDRYIYSDFGDEVGMDVFRFAQVYYGMESDSQFGEVLEKMAGALNISLDKKKIAVKYIRPQFKTPAENDYDKMLKYFETRGISKSTLKHLAKAIVQAPLDRTHKDA